MASATCMKHRRQLKSNENCDGNKKWFIERRDSETDWVKHRAVEQTGGITECIQSIKYETTVGNFPFWKELEECPQRN